MPRAIWSGAISFGLVNVPVKLFSATESKDVHFHQLEEKSGKRIEQKRVAKGTDREVKYDDIVKGYELGSGKYVVVTPDELESVEPAKTRTIEIADFVQLSDIDPIYFEKAYYLAPAKGAEHPYALLRQAMRDSGRIALASFVMRTKEYLAAIRPRDDVLVLETMYFPDEIRPTKDLDVPGKVKISPRERDIATQLIDSLTTEWDPDRYHDTYRAKVLDLVQRKAKGKEVVVEEEEAPAAPVMDLLEALEASIAEAKGKKPAASGTHKTPAKQTVMPRKSGGRRPAKKATKRTTRAKSKAS